MFSPPGRVALPLEAGAPPEQAECPNLCEHQPIRIGGAADAIIMLEVLSDSGLRNVLGFTYVAALLSAVLAVLINQASVDAALELYVLVPLLMISYSSLLLFFLWRCCCTCCCSWRCAPLWPR